MIVIAGLGMPGVGLPAVMRAAAGAGGFSQVLAGAGFSQVLAAAGGFSQALAGVGPLFFFFLAVHVPAGLVAVVSGALAATARKCRGRHTRWGAIYYWAIGVVFVTTAAMTALRPARDWYLLLLGTTSFVLAPVGRHARRHPRARIWLRWPGHIPHILAMGGSYTVLLTAFYVDNGKNLPLWDRLPTAAYWVLPTLVAAPVIALSAVRHRRSPVVDPEAPRTHS
jgi:hypothetical protein